MVVATFPGVYKYGRGEGELNANLDVASLVRLEKNNDRDVKGAYFEDRLVIDDFA